MLRKWGMIVFMLLATPILVFAQNSGKIQGVVTDAETGDPIPGAQVVLAGTTLGTLSDVDGNYFMLGVPVGTYDMEARFVGYQIAKVNGVEISTGYTQEVNFALAEGLELDEVVVEYERPIIQKDAIGVPKIVSGEDIVNLPVRGIADVAKIQAGISSEEGSGTLNVRGGRGNEVQYFIDGVKVEGSSALPQSAIQEQEMVIGNISAAYGDAMSGIINITTKSGSPNFFGSFEGTTSEALDGFGYNLAAGSIGGPIIADKVNFFLSAEYVDQKDDSPRAGKELRLDDDMLDYLDGHPQSFGAIDANGNEVFLAIPAEMAGGAYIPVDADGHAIVNADNQIVASDGTVIDVPEGVSADAIQLDNLTETGGEIDPSNFKLDKVKRGRKSDSFRMNSNIDLNLLQDVRLRLGGRYVHSEAYNLSTNSAVFAPYDQTYGQDDTYSFNSTWTHYLSNSTFYQLQGSWTRTVGEDYDPRFGDPGDPGSESLNDMFDWGDLDGEGAAERWPVIRGYKSVSFVERTYNEGTADEYTAQTPTYNYRYADGQFPGREEVLGLVTPSGGTGPQGYAYNNNSWLRFQATATTQIGLHQIEFGGEFEQRTQRSWSLSGTTLAQYYADSDPERLEGTGVTSLDQLPFNQFPSGSYVGYNFRGTEKVDTENLDAYVLDDTLTFGDAAYDVAPYKPIYYGGYVQDKIEFRDIVLNLGIRVDVYDNNTRREYDPYSRLPLERAGELGLTSNIIGDDYAVYFNGDNVAGYRDLHGNFYDADGQRVQGGDILLTGAKPRQKSNVPTEESYVDFEPAVTVMPRIGVSFPVTNEALFFARYGIVSQRPPGGRNSSSLHSFASPTGMTANGLKPESTTEYEIGFRQRLGARSALTISGFFRQIEDLIQIDDRLLAYPSGVTTYANTDFGTVKGIEMDFDLRRTGNVALNANYTLSYAQGTGSGDRSTSIIAWVDETPPNFISPLDFDQRHKVNLSVDYRLGEGEGPMVGGVRLFENFGVNVLATAGSGRPYTPQLEPFGVIESKPPIPKGGINSDRLPWSNRIDLRVDRRFSVGSADMSVFLNIQNLFDVQNVQGVWRATGLPFDDGYLSTPAGQSFLSGGRGEVGELLYEHRTRGLGAVGIPRLTRIGVRLDF